ncbi:MAG: hypothetical protein QW706_08500 [Candidatus Nezhaarchaeales archaeon]
MAQATPKKVGGEDAGRLARFSRYVSDSMRTIKLSIQERAAIAQRFINPLPMQSLEHAQLGRAMGRLGAVVVDPRRIHVRQELLLRSSDGRKLFLESMRDSLKTAISGLVPTDKVEGVGKTIDAKFNELVSRVESGKSSTNQMTSREFVAMVNKAVAELSKELGVKNLPTIARSLALSQFMNMHVLKSGNKIALLDPFTNKAVLIDRASGEAKEISMTSKEVDEALKNKGIDPEKAPKNLREIEELRGVLKKLRAEGFKIGASKLVDIREKALAGRALAESISTGRSIQAVYSQKLEEDLKADPEFYKAFQEKASKEIAKSINAAALANTMMETFTKLPAKFTAMFARLAAAISRYVPLVGPIVSVGTEATAMFTEYGEAISEKAKSLLTNSVWSLRDIVNEKLRDNPILSNISLTKSISQEVPVTKEQVQTQTQTQTQISTKTVDQTQTQVQVTTPIS